MIADISKFKHYGAPEFRLNITCKYGEACKYGKYSCKYSHESFCKFLKNNRSCQNQSCTHNHDLPLEFKLAQALLQSKSQFPSHSSSFESPNSASTQQFSTNSISGIGTPVPQLFRFNANEPYTETHEKKSTTNFPMLFQPQNKADPHFTAFSPMFQQPANQNCLSPEIKSASPTTKPHQIPSKKDIVTPQNRNTAPRNAQQTPKTSENSQKAADQKSPLPPRVIAPNQLPPPVNQPQKAQFQPQIKQPTRANLILATSLTPLQRSSPGFTSRNPNSPHNSLEEINFAAFPAAPAPAFLYDVVSIANVRDYKDTVCGATGNAANRPDLSLPSMETNSSSPSQRLAPGTPSKPAIITSLKELTTVDDLTMPQQKAEEKQNQEIRQQLETLLLSNPKLKTDLNLNEQRFYYKALNPHLTKAQIDSKSSEEMLVFLGNKIKDSKTTEINFQNPNSQNKTSFSLKEGKQPSNIELNSKSYLQKSETSNMAKTHQPHAEPMQANPSTLHVSKSPQIKNKNSCNTLNESSSPLDDEGKSAFPTSNEENLPFKTIKEQPVYIFPPILDYPEDDMHEFYYPSDFPNYSHLQIVCSYFRLGPIFNQVTSSLEYFEYQKDCLVQRPLENNLIKNTGFMTNLTRYAKFYLSYDLQDPDNQANKQYIFIDSRTGKISTRRRKARNSQRH